MRCIRLNQSDGIWVCQMVVAYRRRNEGQLPLTNPWARSNVDLPFTEESLCVRHHDG